MGNIKNKSISVWGVSVAPQNSRIWHWIIFQVTLKKINLGDTYKEGMHGYLQQAFHIRGF